MSEVSETEESGTPFIGQRRRSAEVTSGGGARHSQIKGRGEGGSWQWSRAAGNP
jgi:hypothetical protein